MILIYLAYLSFTRGPESATNYLEQFAGDPPPLRETLATMIELIVVGLAPGGW